MSIEQVSPFYRFNSDIIDGISDFLDDPNTIIALRWLFTRAVLRKSSKAKNQAFIENPACWSRYFQRMFSTDPTELNQVKAACQNEGVSLCEKVCSFAHHFLGFSHAYELTSPSLQAPSQMHRFILMKLPHWLDNMPKPPVCGVLPPLSPDNPGHLKTVFCHLFSNDPSIFEKPMLNYINLEEKIYSLVSSFYKWDKQPRRVPEAKINLERFSNKTLYDVIQQALAAGYTQFFTFNHFELKRRGLTFSQIIALMQHNWVPDNRETCKAFLHIYVPKIFQMAEEDPQNRADYLQKLQYFSAVLNDLELLKQTLALTTPAPDTMRRVIESDQVETFQLFLDYGMPLDASMQYNSNGRQINHLVLHKVASRGAFNILKLLIESGADIDLKNDAGTTPLFWALYGERSGIVQYLVEKGADINAVDKAGNTPLIQAILEYPQAVPYLVEKGADIHLCNEESVTPLFHAVKHKKFEIVQYLVQKGADVTARDIYHESLLHWAVDTGNTNLVQYLIDKGAQVNATTRLGDTPLHWAVDRNHMEMVECLLQNRADAKITNDSGATPIDEARKNEHHTIADYLESTLEAVQEPPLKRRKVGEK